MARAELVRVMPAVSRIAVGIDGSSGALVALDWAGAEAASYGARLVIVGAWTPGSRTQAAPVSRAAALAVVDRAAAEVAGAYPSVSVERLIEQGEPALVLVRVSESIEMLVVGTRGRGPFGGLPFGSVSHACLANARCSVTVVRPGHAAGSPLRTIVVGVDGSPDGEQVLDWAAAEAMRCGAVLDVVNAWTYPGTAGYAAPGDADVPPYARQVVSMALEHLAARAPSVPVRADIHRGPPLVALAEASRQADLLVLGSRGFGAFQGMRIGAVSEHLAREVSCSVVVVRDGGGTPSPES